MAGSVAHHHRIYLHKKTCVGAKRDWVRTEVAAHVELVTHGHTPRYKRLEHASERAFMRARRAGCGWTHGKRKR